MKHDFLSRFPYETVITTNFKIMKAFLLYGSYTAILQFFVIVTILTKASVGRITMTFTEYLNFEIK